MHIHDTAFLISPMEANDPSLAASIDTHNHAYHDGLHHSGIAFAKVLASARGCLGGASVFEKRLQASEFAGQVPNHTLAQELVQKSCLLVMRSCLTLKCDILDTHKKTRIYY